MKLSRPIYNILKDYNDYHGGRIPVFHGMDSDNNPAESVKMYPGDFKTVLENSLNMKTSKQLINSIFFISMSQMILCYSVHSL